MHTKNNEKLTYFLYARKSSDSEDRQVQSIDDQVKYFKEQASRLNIEIKEIFTEAKSAKKPNNRPVFTEMVKRIEKGEANGILCWKLNRLARNPVDGGALTWLLQNSIIKHIKTADGNFYPTDNVLLISVEFGIANQYIIDLRRDCKRGMEGRAQRGWFPTMPPAGYMNDKNEHTIVIDKERFALIRKMWDLMLTGNYSPQQIREIANTQWGFRTKQFKRQGGGPIANCTIYKLFTNIFYIGMFKWGGKLYNGNHTPMVTLEEFDRVQALLGKNGRPRPVSHEFAYTGMMTCAECGCMITASEKRKLVKKNSTVKMYVYYHCTKKKKTLACKQKPVTITDFEKQIIDVLEEDKLEPCFLSWSLELINAWKGKEIEHISKVRQMREQSLSRTENELANLTRMRYRELIDDDTFTAEQNTLQGQIARLKQELQQTDNHSEKWIELTEKAFRFVTHAKYHFENGTIQHRKEILAALGSNFTVKDKILLFHKAEWLAALEKCYQPFRAELKRLELTESPYYTRQKAQIQPLILRWRTAVEDVRKVFEKLGDTEIHIPYLSQDDPTHPPP